MKFVLDSTELDLFIISMRQNFGPNWLISACYIWAKIYDGFLAHIEWV